MSLFEVTDKNGKEIRLTEKQWKHINQEHPNINDWRKIKEAVKRPTTIRTSTYNSEVKWFYRWNKPGKRYLLVAVKYLNSEGFIITAYYTKDIQ